jgi:V/A-type H+-transporting ATPase subunit A
MGTSTKFKMKGQVLGIHEPLVFIEGVFPIGAQVGVDGNQGKVISFTQKNSTVLMYDFNNLQIGAQFNLISEINFFRGTPDFLNQALDSFGKDLENRGEKITPYILNPPQKEYSLTLKVKDKEKVIPGQVIREIQIYKPNTAVFLSLPICAKETGIITNLTKKEKIKSDTIICFINNTPITYEEELYQGKPTAKGIIKKEAYKRLTTHVRAVDMLFPFREGRCHLLAGGFGSGKSSFQEHLVSSVGFDVSIFVACGERGNEVTELVHSFEHKPSTIKALSLFINLSNMSLAKKGASVLSGIYFGKYLAEKGLKVGVMVDSLSRWREAVKEIEGILGNLPSEGGYPARFRNELRNIINYRGVYKNEYTGQEGSLSIFLSLSPPKRTVTDYIVASRAKMAPTMIFLDAEMRKKRIFPAIGFVDSFSLFSQILKNEFDIQHPGFFIRQKFLQTKLNIYFKLLPLLAIMQYSDLENEQKIAYDLGNLLIYHFIRQASFQPGKEITDITHCIYLIELLKKAEQICLHTRTEYIYEKSPFYFFEGAQKKDITYLHTLAEKIK